MFEEQRQQWSDMDKKWKVILGSICVLGPIMITLQTINNNKADAVAEQKRVETLTATQNSRPGENYQFSALPTTNRNQGLEDLQVELQRMRNELDSYKRSPGAAPQSGVNTGYGSPDVNLNAPLNLPPISGSGTSGASGATGSLNLDALDGPKPKTGKIIPPEIENPPRAKVKVWPADTAVEAAKDQDPKLVVPVNSGLEGVLLTGVNARPSGAAAGAVGAATSATNVGAPFVTKLKGDAIMPNGWKLADLGDCFLGGSAVAVLSAERAFSIADKISCIALNGDVYEADVKAYGVDVDGIQGLSGKVVSKQGAILARSFLTGIAGGLGTALAPTSVPGFNSSSSGGSQSYVTPDPAMVARSSVGTGVSNAASQLSRFYLDFAKETFPVIEIPAGTRITWILKESLEFKRTNKGKN